MNEENQLIADLEEKIEILTGTVLYLLAAQMGSDGKDLRATIIDIMQKRYGAEG